MKNRFVLKLVDTTGDVGEQYVAVETNKTLQEVIDVYNKARKEWYDDEGRAFDCLTIHLFNRLSENEMCMTPITWDARLDF